MNLNPFLLEPYSVHLWYVVLPELFSHVEALSLLLSVEELQRAERLHFKLHRDRYIVARAVLRQILSLYTQIAPEKILFKQGEKGKPYLQLNPLHIQFNTSHSHDLAVYAITTHAEIGVDIEKVENKKSNEAVAKRFYSDVEYAELMHLAESERISAFYRIWSAKEALIKALGQGLYSPLSAFSVDFQKVEQTVVLSHDYREHHYHVNYFSVDPAYQAAFAVEQVVLTTRHWQWTETGFELR